MEIGQELLVETAIEYIRVQTERAGQSIIGTVGVSLNGKRFPVLPDTLDEDDTAALRDLVLTAICKTLVATYIVLRDTYDITYTPEVYDVDDLKLAMHERFDPVSEG